MAEQRTGTGPVTQLWETTIVAQFEADNAEDAAAIAERLTVRVLDHPQTWAVDGEFDPEQKTETVDA